MSEFRGTRSVVTGDAGFIGSHLCDASLDAGSEVVAYVPGSVDVNPFRPIWTDGRLAAIDRPVVAKGPMIRSPRSIDCVAGWRSMLTSSRR